jgi:hypothetical protein
MNSRIVALQPGSREYAGEKPMAVDHPIEQKHRYVANKTAIWLRSRALGTVYQLECSPGTSNIDSATPHLAALERTGNEP